MPGVGTLIQLILRRDRLKLPIWLFGIIASLLAMVPLLKNIYGDDASIQVLYQTFSMNPAGNFITGPMDRPDFAAFFTLETLLWWGMAVAFMNTLFVVRHTRHNEEIGAQELILSGRVSRGADLLAAMIVALGINAILVVALGFGLGMLGVSWGAQENWTYGLAIGLFGMVWAAISAVVVQLVGSGRTANGILAALIGGMFVVRGIGDFLGTRGVDGLHEPMWVSWLSPYGWMQAARPLTQPEWWPLFISLGFVLAVIPVAFILHRMRDVGAGILHAKSGRARARKFLATPLGMIMYLQKNIFIGWLVGVVAMVVTIGALVPEMSKVYEGSPELMNMITAIGGAGELVPAFLSAMMAITVMMVVAYAIQGIGKLRSEESSGRLENILATKVSRLKWLTLHGFVVLLGSLVMLIATGGLLAISVNSLTDMRLDVVEYIAAGVSYLPLAFVFVAGYIFLFGVLPRAAGLISWLYFGFMAFMLWIGPIIKADQRIMDLSPMAHLPAVPTEAVETSPLIVLVVIGMVLSVAGIVIWRRRDVQTG